MTIPAQSLRIRRTIALRIGWGVVLAMSLAHSRSFGAGPVVTVNFSEDASTFIENPERGMYKALNLLDPGLEAACRAARAEKYSVVYTKAILPRNTYDLSYGFLSQMTDGFRAIERCGAKAVVRFYYLEDDKVCPKDSSGVCIDPPLNLIKSHVAQLREKLRRHEHVITAFQAGLLGPWGEWHSSTLSNYPYSIGFFPKKEVLLALLDAVPPMRMVQVRTPLARYQIFSGHISQEVDPNRAIGALYSTTRPFDGSPDSRTGHHNDCFLSSPTDRGTYSSTLQKRENQKAYIAQNTRFTPMGGETCDFASESDIPLPEKLDEWRKRAVGEMKSMHWTYLHGGYSAQVLGKLGKFPVADVSQGDSTWQEITRKLGYRFVAPSVSFTPTVTAGNEMSFVAQIKNIGFAALYNSRPVYLVLHNALRTYQFPLGVDPRRWEPDQTVTVSQSIRIPLDAAPGHYTISLWMPDAYSSLRLRPEYSVRFAHHSAYWDAGKGYNVLKTLGIEIKPASVN